MRRWSILGGSRLLIVSSVPTCACTILYAADGEVMLGANNEDWHVPLTKVWFVPGEEDTYGAAYVTFSNLLSKGDLRWSPPPSCA